MTQKFQPKGCVTEFNFGYNAKTGVYTNSSSDITKLGETRYAPLKRKGE